MGNVALDPIVLNVSASFLSQIPVFSLKRYVYLAPWGFSQGVSSVSLFGKKIVDLETASDFYLNVGYWNVKLQLPTDITTLVADLAIC